MQMAISRIIARKHCLLYTKTKDNTEVKLSFILAITYNNIIFGRSLKRLVSINMFTPVIYIQVRILIESRRYILMLWNTGSSRKDFTWNG